MAEAAQTEFWRDLKPIEKVFQPSISPEMYIAGLATDDQRDYVPLSETVGTRPSISPAEQLVRRPDVHRRRAS